MSLVDDLSERRGSSAAKREAQCRSRADLRLAGHTARSRTHHCQPAKRLDGSAPISNFYFVWSWRRYATGRSEFALSLRIGQKIQTLSRTDSLGLTRWAGVCSQRCLPGTGKRAGELPSCAHKKQQAAKPSPDPGFRRRCPENFERYLVQILDGAGSGWPLN